MQEIVFRNWQW